MVLPKSVTINGLVWKIKYEPCDVLGEFDEKERAIVVDDSSDEFRQKEILMHELLEICMLENSVIYEPYPLNGDDEGRFFAMNHRQFRAVSKTFYGVISQIYEGQK